MGLVADEIDTLHLVQAALGSQGFRVTSAASEEQTLAAARSERPDLIVVRVASSGIDGIAVAQRLKHDATMAAIPLLAIMGQSGPDLHQRAQRADFDALLLKPITSNTLAEIVPLLIERGRLRREQSARQTPSSVTYRCNAGGGAERGAPERR